MKERNNKALIIITKSSKSKLLKSRLDIPIKNKQLFWKLCLDFTLKKCLQMKYIDFFISYFPPSARNEIENIGGPEFEIFSANKNNFGEAIKDTYLYCFSKGYKIVANIAPDSPDTPINYINNGMVLAHKSDVVLGPAFDGGYYFLAMNKPKVEIFRQVEWGTTNVFRQIVENINSLRLKFSLVPMWYDIDEIKDMKLLRNNLYALKSSRELNFKENELLVFLDTIFKKEMKRRRI